MSAGSLVVTLVAVAAYAFSGIAALATSVRSCPAWPGPGCPSRG